MKRALKIRHDITERTAQGIVQGLQQLTGQGESSPITIAIDTPGGEIDPMNKILSAMKDCSSPLHGIATGKAHSAGFLILQHCAKRLAYPDASFLFHAPRISAETISRFTTFPAEEDIVQDDSELHQQMIALIAERSGRSQDEVRELGRQERVLTAQEALALGLINEIVSCAV